MIDTVSYWYQRDQARTGLAGNASPISGYERGGWLKRIEYGTRLGQETAGNPPAQVVFEVEDRCLASSCWLGSSPAHHGHRRGR